MKAKVKLKSKKSPSKLEQVQREELLGLRLAINDLQDGSDDLRMDMRELMHRLTALERRTFWDLFLSKGGRP